MKKTNVYFLSLKQETPTRGYWAYGLVEEYLKDFEWHEVRDLPREKQAVVVISGGNHADMIDQVNKELAKIEKVLLFVLGDEELLFPVERIDHPFIITWVQSPRMGRHDKYRRIGFGYPQDIHDNLSNEAPDKNADWFFAGQITHSRRREMVDQLESLPYGVLIKTAGFTQGLEHSEYYEQLARARVVPCPAGAETVDTFRLFEALELGCVPIADMIDPKKESIGYWEWLFGCDVPFSTIQDYKTLPLHIETIAAQYPRINNRVQAWWLQQKRKWYENIRCDIEDIGGENKRSDYTFIVPVSPIKSHPDTKILEETIKSIRYHFKEAEIIITFDGIRDEQKHLEDVYEEHIRRVLWMCNKYTHVTPYIFDTHTHQVGMAKHIIETIKTPLLVYVEQDTPLVTDEIIDWDIIGGKIKSKEANVIRLHFEARVPKEHNHLMIGEAENGFLKTIQWSQRPHIASVEFYQEMLRSNFTENAKCFIEDAIHGKVQDDYNLHGMEGWEKWKLFIYHPEGKNIKRSLHTDGRSGEEKYDESQIW